MKDKEHQEQKKLIEWTAYNLGKYPELRWLFAIPNGGQRHIKVASKMKAEGVKAGVWDLFLPVAKEGYHGLFIEMKIKPNKLNDNQVEFQEFIDKQGYKSVVCYSWGEAQEELINYLESA